MQILADDRMTLVGDTTNATAQGTGATVRSGIGHHGTVGDTFFLNEIPAAGSTTNLSQ
jgi:hypothetical protein